MEPTWVTIELGVLREGALGQQAFPGSYELLNYYAFAPPFDAIWQTMDVVLAAAGFRRVNPLGISLGVRRSRKN